VQLLIKSFKFCGLVIMLLGSLGCGRSRVLRLEFGMSMGMEDDACCEDWVPLLLFDDD
jgi:hypothetical protein